ncbi:FIST C-terminal domain-containing protein [Leptolyngbya sp. 7M]|uniref:FIST C-terminal domain-containing protein n=1 Tax=Leptolyngbya sp. 7M TaxID=2812896 RepID=UPI002939533F|nr:FIST C-terminal domain-containing protein [Leptolyngbya sp. 7M]
MAQSAFKQQLEQGDFLIRNLLGVDPRTGAIAVGDRIRPGQRIQFHLRDATASADDLSTLLTRYRMHCTSTTSPVGALLFSCMGRGESLYEEPNFDSRLFTQHVGQISLSGFFCNGEIGPVGGTTFLHGYTSVFGICRPAE